MAKKLLLDVLVNVLGNYVEGLSPENLRVGVWSGKVELRNLKLKSTALDTLNLPIKISHGALKFLRLKVPWSHLESKPVRVVIDGVYLQCGPLDVSSLTVEELRARVLVGKRERLKAAMAAVLQAQATQDEKAGSGDLRETARQASYIQQLTTKIIDNIEVTLTNVHIRYEDSSTLPGQTFSAGVTIESISLVTTDDKWVETFVDIIKSHDASVHKLGRMVNLGVYWSTGSEPLEGLDPDGWERAMQRRIYTQKPQANSIDAVESGNGSSPLKTTTPAKMPVTTPGSSAVYAASPFSGLAGSEAMQHLLSLPNAMSVKLTHTEAPKEGSPKLDVIIDIEHFGFSLDQAQYQQIIMTTNRFAQLDRQKQMALHRPSKRPTSDPRAWWHYAYKLVTGSELSFQKKLDKMITVLRKKDRYIWLVKQAHTAEGELLSKIDAELSVMEDTLPMSSLLVFRQIAGLQIAEDVRAAKREKASESNTKGISGMTSRLTSMFSWGKKAAAGNPANSKPEAAKRPSATNASLEDDDDALMAKIQSTLHQAEVTAVDSFTLRLSFSSSAKLEITSSLRPIVSAVLAMDAHLEIHAKNIRMTYTLSNLSI